MKKINVIVCFFFMCTLFAQQKQMTPGKYVSDKDGVTINVNEDQTFELIFLEGKYTTKNDTIYFNNRLNKKDSFVIKETKHRKDNDSITIALQSDAMYYMDQIYLGLQEKGKGQVVYKSILSYLKIKSYDFSDEKKYTFKIPKTKTLYLVEGGYKRDQPTISTYTIQTKTSGLAIEYQPSKFNDLNLKGYYDTDKNKFRVTDGRKPLFFIETKDIAAAEEESRLQPVKIVKDETWKAPQEETQETVIENKENGQVRPNYKPSGSLKKAIQELAKATQEKYLMVSYNPDVVKGKEDFITYTNSRSAADTLYNYYLAKAKDKKLFENHGIANQAGIVILNEASDILYYAPGSLGNNERSIDYYIKKDIKTATILAQFDATLQQDKVTPLALKKAFESIEPLDDYQFAEKFITSTAKKETPKRAYFYTLKTSKTAVNTAWSTVLATYIKKDSLDHTVLKLVQKELNRDGFNKMMFNENDELCSVQDIEAIRYVLQFYKNIETKQKRNACNCGCNHHSNEHVKKKEIDQMLLSVFSKNMDTYYNATTTHMNTIQSLFKELVSKSNNDYKITQSYLNTLKRDLKTNKEEYYNVYQGFYTAYFSANTNIFESLNAIYTSSTSASQKSWSDVKYAISNQANDVAWSIVEHKDTAYKNKWIDAAIQWSEMSVKIAPDSPYYLDTLAQLYYQHGDKEKAIAMQEKAKVAGEQQLDAEGSVLKEIKSVLVKMKKGTY